MHSSPLWWWPRADRDPPAAARPTTCRARSRTPSPSWSASAGRGRDADRKRTPAPAGTGANSPRCSCHCAAASASSTARQFGCLCERIAAIHLPKRGPQQRLVVPRIPFIYCQSERATQKQDNQFTGDGCGRVRNVWCFLLWGWILGVHAQLNGTMQRNGSVWKYFFLRKETIAPLRLSKSKQRKERKKCITGLSVHPWYYYKKIKRNHVN